MQRLHIIIGATASGKEATACALAELWQDAEIIVVDSMKVYRGLDIGTAKPSRGVRDKIPHHGLDLVPPTVEFSAADFVKFCTGAIAEIASRNHRVILVGGTALYYFALLSGLNPLPAADPELREKLAAESPEILYARLQEADELAAQKIHPNDVKRVIRALEVITLTGKKLSNQQTQWDNFYGDRSAPPSPESALNKKYDARVVWLHWDRTVLRQRIANRVQRMLADGLLAEANRLFENREKMAKTPLQAVGYKEFFPYFNREISLAAATAEIITRTGQLAKSQDTWFRKFSATKILINSEDDFSPENIARRADEIFASAEPPPPTPPATVEIKKS